MTKPMPIEMIATVGRFVRGIIHPLKDSGWSKVIVLL